MFTADGKPSDDDPREHKARLGDERTTLAESLRGQRLTLEMKCSGLDAEAMAQRSVAPSTMSLLGLVRHLAEMERATFRVLMAGHGDFDGAVPDPQVVAQAWDAGARRWTSPPGLRPALVGMIEEYARHMGHADLLRERIDGRIGQ